MKLAFFNDYQLGVIKADGIVDISDALSGHFVSHTAGINTHGD